MALIKCPECGKEVSDKAIECPQCKTKLKETDPVKKVCLECGKELQDDEQVCPKCGCPVPAEKEEVSNDLKESDSNVETSEDISSEEKKVKKTIPPKWLIIGGVIIAAVAIISFFATSNLRAYHNAKTLCEEENYKEAIEKFSDLDEYKDSKKLLEKCRKLYAIQTDKIAPEISGIEESSVIEVTCGTEFNLNEYLKDKISISDDVTTNLEEYYTDCDEEVYDSISGKVNTMIAGEFPLELSAKDEAGNVGTLGLNLKLNPVRVTKENPNPVVYDGEYGTVAIKSFQHGFIEGMDQYKIEFDINNKTEDDMVVYLSTSSTFINDYQVGAYYTISSITSGKRGTMDGHIYEQDIPDDIGSYSTIESVVCLSKGDDEKSYFRIPIIFEVNVSR